MERYMNCDWMRKEYTADGMLFHQIAAKLGCHRSTISRWMRKCGIRTIHSYHPPRPIDERFWDKVDVRDSDECWPWTAGLTSTGYGTICNKRHMVRAHRLSWELHNGPIPDGMLVCHTCDNKICVNPRHLYVGTYADNNRDTVSRGHRPTYESLDMAVKNRRAI